MGRGRRERLSMVVSVLVTISWKVVLGGCILGKEQQTPIGSVARAKDENSIKYLFLCSIFLTSST